MDVLQSSKFNFRTKEMKKILRCALTCMPLLVGLVTCSGSALGSFVINASGKSLGVDVNWADAPNVALLKNWGNHPDQAGAMSVVDNWLTTNSYGTAQTYKKERDDGVESGIAKDVYNTTFIKVGDNFTDATITWTGANLNQALIGATHLFLKDGNATPNWYLFDISAWNGVATIELKNFFGKSISNIVLFNGSLAAPPAGGPTAPIPEPSTSVLMLLGLTAFSSGIFRGRRKL